MTATRWVLPATILGSSLGFIDGSVVNVALPAIRADLTAELAALQWVVNGYMLTLASLILIGGSAGDRFGRRRIFLVGLVGFAAASLACGLSPTAATLIAARLVQGAAAALLMPSSLAIIGAAYTGDARGPAIGTWAAAGALTTALGPVLGGWLVDTVGWRAIFFINLPRRRRGGRVRAEAAGGSRRARRTRRSTGAAPRSRSPRSARSATGSSRSAKDGWPSARSRRPRPCPPAGSSCAPSAGRRRR